MRYWWVSQNQTFDQEVHGGYMWSPKVNRNGSISHFYECMREISPGDLVFSFCSREIRAIGFAIRHAYTCPKPIEFGSSGSNWNNIGWRVDVAYQVLRKPIEPRRHMDLLRPLLPSKYSPIRANGDGNEIYLTELSSEFAQVLRTLIGKEADMFIAHRPDIVLNTDTNDKLTDNARKLLTMWDQAKLNEVQNDRNLDETEKEQVVKSRRGQGIFRNRVSEIEKFCRITGVAETEHLIASHIKPWKVSDNKERLDGENGLFLTPSIDHLFGDGYISFKDNGDLLVSDTTSRMTLIKMGIPKNNEHNVGKFTKIQSRYLEYHRDSIFLKARA